MFIGVSIRISLILCQSDTTYQIFCGMQEGKAGIPAVREKNINKPPVNTSEMPEVNLRQSAESLQMIPSVFFIRRGRSPDSPFSRMVITTD